VIFFGVEVEHMARTLQEEPPALMRGVAWAFTVFFACELIARICSEGCKSFFTSPAWRLNVLDTSIVMVSVVEVAFLFGLGTSVSQLPLLRVLRTVRLMRLLRVIRIMQYFRPLRILICSVLSTLRSLMWTLILLVIILYIFGLLFMQSTTQHRAERQDQEVDPRLPLYFGSLWQATFTLFKCVTGGVDWHDVSEPLGTLHPMMTMFFVTFIAFTYFAVLNVVTGVFCQMAIESADKDEDMVIQAQLAQKSKYTQRLEKLFQSIDIHNTGFITLANFEESMEEEWFKAYFASMDLTVDQAFSLFKLLDFGNKYQLDINAFVAGCLRLRGSPRNIDIALMGYESRWTMHKFLELLKDMQSQFVMLRKQISRDSMRHFDSTEPSPASGVI